jgi:hypothetical protein
MIWLKAVLRGGLPVWLEEASYRPVVSSERSG